MSKRQILSAAKRKGIVLDSVEYGWEPTPGESVPCWSIYVSDQTQEQIEVEPFVQFENTAEVLGWIDSLPSAIAQQRKVVADYDPLEGTGDGGPHEARLLKQRKENGNG